MKRILSSCLLFSILVFPVAGLVGCGEESKTGTKETITAPGGTTTTTSENKVKSTGSNPPLNSAGETGKTAK
jgi:hypothetical protein